MKKLLYCLCLLLLCSKLYADGAVFVPIYHSDLLNTGTNTHDQIDSFIASKGQPGGIAALNGSGTISGTGLVLQQNGTGTGNQFTNISIVSGTGTLQGVAAPYVGQINGTGTGNTFNNALVTGSSTIQSSSTSPSYVSGNLAVGSTTSPCKFLVVSNQVPGHVKYADTVALIENNAACGLEIASMATSTGSIIFSDENRTGGAIFYNHILDRLYLYIGEDLTNLGNAEVVIDSTGILANSGVRYTKVGSSLGTGTIEFVGVGDTNISAVFYANGNGSVTINSTSGSGSSKPNIAQDGVLKATAPGTVSFNIDFTVDANGSVSTKGLVKQNGGTASSTILTNVQINSGTGSLSGVSSPYLAQISGTGTEMTIGSVSVNHNGAAITGGAISGVDICFGDNDTGFNWLEDGHIQLKTNANPTININSNVIPTTVGIGSSTFNTETTVYGSLTVTGNIVGTLTSKAYGMAYRTANQDLSAGTTTWTTVSLNGGNNNLYNATHSASLNPERLKVSLNGTYRIDYMAHFSDPSGSGDNLVVSRLVKNGSTEIPGSYAALNIEDNGSGEMQVEITRNILYSLAANDYVTLQVGVRNSSGDLKILSTGTIPISSGSYTAYVVVEKIGEL